MILYDCKIRLGGSLYNEVRRQGLTPAEIAVLKVLHGDDAVVDLVASGEDKMLDPTGLRATLTARYGDALAKIEGVKNLNGIFGVAGALPESIPGISIPGRRGPKPKPKAELAPVEDPIDDLESTAV